jgi:hypothetical protein
MAPPDTLCMMNHTISVACSMAKEVLCRMRILKPRPTPATNIQTSHTYIPRVDARVHHFLRSATSGRLKWSQKSKPTSLSNSQLHIHEQPAQQARQIRNDYSAMQGIPHNQHRTRWYLKHQGQDARELVTTISPLVVSGARRFSVENNYMPCK